MRLEMTEVYRDRINSSQRIAPVAREFNFAWIGWLMAILGSTGR